MTILSNVDNTTQNWEGEILVLLLINKHKSIYEASKKKTNTNTTRWYTLISVPKKNFVVTRQY